MPILFKHFFFVVIWFLFVNGYTQTDTPSIENAESSGELPLKQRWYYSYRDNFKNALMENDIDWSDSVNTTLNKNDVNRINFKGYVWLRLAFFVPQNFKEDVFALEVEQQGASQFFINNQFVKQYGFVSKITTEEIKHNGNNEPIFFVPKKGNVNVIVVRYSYHDDFPEWLIKSQSNMGFNVTFHTQSSCFNNQRYSSIIYSILGLGLAIFLLTLSLVHLLLYVFYKTKKANLYQVFFTGLLASYFLRVYLQGIFYNPLYISVYNTLVLLSIPFLFLGLLQLLNSIYEIIKPKTIFFIFIIFNLFLLGIFVSEVFILFMYIPIVFCLILSLKIVFKAIKIKLNGSAIIGIGFSVFILFSLIIISLTAINDSSTINIQTNEGIAILIFISILSVPITMSIYLGYDFAITNKSLSKKLIEVEQLSQLSIKQEHEKQLILAKQNEVLEEQVTERTKEITEQKSEIEVKQKEIIDSINYAKRIQQAVLTGEDVWSKISQEYFILFKPKDIVSGDFYWAYNTPNGRSIFALADCTGHGVPGGFMSMLGNSFLNEIVVENKIFKANEILNRLRAKVIAALEQKGQTEQKDGMDISLCVWNKMDNTLEFAAANNPLWLLRKTVSSSVSSRAESRDEIREIIEYKADKMPIGTYLEIEKPFTSTTIQLQQGDILYLSTDGYADQFGGPKGKKFKYKALLDMLMTNSTLEMGVQKTKLDDAFVAWKNKQEQVDDVAVIGVRVMG